MIETIVAIAYNREKSLLRLLKSLSDAYYPHKVDLVISIDKSSNEEVLKTANYFEWIHGNKEVIAHPKNLGLRKHVIFCGELTKKYGTICVFEDDLYVSKNFFSFSEQAVEKYKNEKHIAGFSLYNHPICIESNLPFCPMKNDYDVYAMQYAMSWGQVWTDKQWESFYSWYQKFENEHFNNDYIPLHLSKWPESSWLKYFIFYCIDQSKYFIYPYQSLSTNFSDVGTHAKIMNKDFQVSLENSNENRLYVMPEFGLLNKYDSFFELIPEKTEFDDVEFDLYGCKRVYSKRFVVTSQALNFKLVDRFGLELRPHELNVLNKIEGEYFRLYDTSEIQLSNLELPNDRSFMLSYYYGEMNRKDLMTLLKKKIIMKLNKIMSR
ncbi:glycosyltransferase [Enterococcus gallinarum]|uniref:glycosyltransferase n=1 Tax=Enterococcus TaxID=1350 RepID=UPI003F7572D8